MALSNDAEKRQSQLNNLEATKFRKASELTPEEREKQRAICAMGAKARVEKQRTQRTMKEQALILLNTEISREQARKWIGDKADLIAENDLTVQSVMNVRLMDALFQDGNAKAYEVLRDTSGQTVKQQVELDASLTMTDADRALMDKINARLNKDG